MYEPGITWPARPETGLPDYGKITLLSAPNPIFPAIEQGRVPMLNHYQDVDALEVSYDDLLEVAERDLEEGVDAAHAIVHLGHLDYYAGSLIRHGAQEIAEKPHAQEILSSLGETAGTVPCGTIYTYTSCNNLEPWTFTGTRQEKLFINIVRNHVYATDLGVAAIIGAIKDEQGEDIIAAEQIGLFNEATRSIDVISRAFYRSVASKGKRQQFIDSLQPYFGPISIQGKRYDRASGAHGPAQVIDAAVWGGRSMRHHPGYQKYKSHLRQVSPYLTPNHRNIMHEFNELTDGADILTLARRGELSTEFLVALGGLLGAQHGFRSTHEREARRSFALRKRGSTGSGGGTPDTLQLLRNLNFQAMEEFSGIVEARLQT